MKTAELTNLLKRSYTKSSFEKNQGYFKISTAEMAEEIEAAEMVVVAMAVRGLSLAYTYTWSNFFC